MKDVVVIGAGHNGLVCAAYLAASGLDVHIVERRSVLGGAAVTEEFHPGFRNSVASYAVGLLNPTVIDDLELARHGLEIRFRPQSNFFPISDRESLSFFNDADETQAELARFSARDATAYREYDARLTAVGDLIQELMGETPPNLGGGLAAILRLLSTSRRAQRVGGRVQRDAIALFTLSAAEFLSTFFENDHVKAAFAFDAVVGSLVSPFTPGTAYVLLHHVVGTTNGVRGAWGHAVGGMGSITQAMAKACIERGVTIDRNAAVTAVEIDDSRAKRIRLADGSSIEARAIVANVEPKRLLHGLVGADQLEGDVNEQVTQHKTASGTLRMNVALSELPRFTCRPDAGPHLGSGIVIGPSLDYLERAYRDVRTHGFSRQPIVEMLIPSTIDDSLAPAGQHVASLFCQHFARQGARDSTHATDWDLERERAADTVFATIDAYAPNFSTSVIARDVLTPLDLERRFGLTDGDIFHGRLSLDQLWANRPFPGFADYRMPVKGLYLCGSGAHPGGGVTGLPGRNAAREITKDFRRRRI